MFNERNVGVKTKTLRLLWRKKTEFLIKIQETNTRNVHIVYSRSWIHKTKKKKKKERKKRKKKEKKRKKKKEKEKGTKIFIGYLTKLIVSFLLLYIKRRIIY